ncbi:hypothetical protein JRQ81_012110, partial [Phrynocephalus forsythii]
MAQTQPSQTNQVLNMLSQLSMSQAKLISDQNSAFSNIRAKMREGFAKFDARMDSFCGMLQALEDNMGVMDYRPEEVESTMESTSRQVLMQEVESSSKILRIQGLTFDKDENIYNLVGECLSSLLEIPVEELLREVDVIYRQHTAYTRRNKHPPEVIVKLVRRYTRDCILKAICDKEHDIRYKWIYPEGLTFQWEGKIQKIDSYKKAGIFTEKNAEKLGFSPTSPSSSTSEGEDQSDNQTVTRRSTKDDSQSHQASKQGTSKNDQETGAVGGARPKRQLRSKPGRKHHWK